MIVEGSSKKDAKHQAATKMLEELKNTETKRKEEAKLKREEAIKAQQEARKKHAEARRLQGEEDRKKAEELGLIS